MLIFQCEVETSVKRVMALSKVIEPMICEHARRHWQGRCHQSAEQPIPSRQAHRDGIAIDSIVSGLFPLAVDLDVCHIATPPGDARDARLGRCTSWSGQRLCVLPGPHFRLGDASNDHPVLPSLLISAGAADWRRRPRRGSPAPRAGDCCNCAAMSQPTWRADLALSATAAVTLITRSSRPDRLVDEQLGSPAPILRCRVLEAGPRRLRTGPCDSDSKDAQSPRLLSLAMRARRRVTYGVMSERFLRQTRRCANGRLLRVPTVVDRWPTSRRLTICRDPRAGAKASPRLTLPGVLANMAAARELTSYHRRDTGESARHGGGVGRRLREGESGGARRGVPLGINDLFCTELRP